MSLFHQLQMQLLEETWPTLPSVQNTGPGTSGSLNWPQNTLIVEEQMSQQARQNIESRLKMATLFQKYRAKLISNNHDVSVTSDPLSVAEKICLTVYGNQTVVLLTVKNSGIKTVDFTFRASDLVKDIFTVTDCYGNIIKTIKQLPLGPGESYQIMVHFYSEHGGFYEHLLLFKFKTQEEFPDKFEIMRLLEVKRLTSFSEELLPTATDSLRDLPNASIPAQSYTWLKILVPLKFYTMPNDIKDFKKSNMELEKIPLNWKNYSRRFQLLLHLEEFYLKTKIEKFNQDVTMFRHKIHTNLLFLEVAGFSTDSPLILSGNQVLVTPLDQTGVFRERCYKGWVHHVDVERIYLKFPVRFLNLFKEGLRFRFNFYINRMPLRTQHRATQLVYKNKLKEVLFPTGQFSSHQSQLHRSDYLKVKIQGKHPKHVIQSRVMGLHHNPEQRKAIEHIVAASAKPAPYLVFGPPGTGKTVTLVEAIKQIVKTQPPCNILACAPSNSATDHLCEKILEGKFADKNVYRLYALSFPVKNIPQNIKSRCNLNHKTQTIVIPARVELMMHKIMVTSLQTAGRLVTGGIPSDHYTYLFVDEAGHATETECIIPLAGLLEPNTCQVVLAGDPKQLGPIISSKLAERHGMGVSMLERLMTDNNLYKSHDTHGLNQRFVTKLLRNYRSHPAILKIPNELFYNGELQPYAHKETCNLYCNWEHLPKKGFPLIFHGVAGTDEREDYNPSVYNMAEVEVLKEYLKALVDHLHKNGVTKIEPREIGIITPYRKQVEKIKYALEMDSDLRKENLENILVGSVEQFQGKEFNVTLVSTVRSHPKLTAPKQHFTIGFVDNAKRFNVAMTRARALLIVIGDPRVLKTDQIWNKFIHYCFKQGGYRGITVSDAEEDLSDSPSVRGEGFGNSWTPAGPTNLTYSSEAPVLNLKQEE